MADLDYTSALGDLNFAPAENYYGIGAQSIAQALPSLTNPYASPLSNLGVTLGGALVASLLGYQARKEANDLSLQTQRYANQLLRAETPEARVSFLESLPSDVLESGVGTRLSRLSTALAQQQAVQNALIGQEVAKKKALAEFELGPEGSKLFERQQNALVNQKIAEQEALAKFQLGETGTKLFERDLSKATSIALAQRGGSTIDKDVAREDQKILRYAQSAEAIAKEFDKLNMSAAEFQIQKRIPGSKAEIVYSNLLGNLTNFARLGGQGAQVSDQDRDDQFNSLFGPQVPGLGRISGTDDIAKRIREKIKAAPLSTGSLGSTMDTSSTTAGESPAERRNKQLKAELAELKALIAQRK